MTPLSREIASYLEDRGSIDHLDLCDLYNTNHFHLYKVYEIRQGKSGKKRYIEEPIPELKKVQQILIPLFENFPFYPQCIARRGKSISDNASYHLDAKYILRVDIKQCFQSVRPIHITNALDIYVPEYLLKGLMLDALPFCIFNNAFIPRQMRSNRKVVPVLPTGAPTSPILCNIALTPVDKDILELIKGKGYQYSRYMDDIHLSTTNEKRDWSLLPEVTKILEHHNFEINKKKSKWMTNASDSVVITGVQLGAKSKVPKDFRRMLRAKLCNLAKDKRDLDKETLGCLGYVKSIDENKYQEFLEYYERRRMYVPAADQ